MVTLPVARIVTGVLVAFFVNFSVVPDGTLTVVKLKTPLAGRASVVVPAPVRAPPTPVLPLLKVWASAHGRPTPTRSVPVTKTTAHRCRMPLDLLPNPLTAP